MTAIKFKPFSKRKSSFNEGARIPHCVPFAAKKRQGLLYIFFTTSSRTFKMIRRFGYNRVPIFCYACLTQIHCLKRNEQCEHYIKCYKHRELGARSSAKPVVHVFEWEGKKSTRNFFLRLPSVWLLRTTTTVTIASKGNSKHFLLIHYKKTKQHVMSQKIVVVLITRQTCVLFPNVRSICHTLLHNNLGPIIKNWICLFCSPTMCVWLV